MGVENEAYLIYVDERREWNNRKEWETFSKSSCSQKLIINPLSGQIQMTRHHISVGLFSCPWTTETGCDFQV